MEHPTQVTACGTGSKATALSAADFDHVPAGTECKTCKRLLLTRRAGRRASSDDARVLTITLPSELADAIDDYLVTDWASRDPSKLGALNAVSYIGERLVGIYRKANER